MFNVYLIMPGGQESVIESYDKRGKYHPAVWPTMAAAQRDVDHWRECSSWNCSRDKFRYEYRITEVQPEEKQHEL